MIFKHYIIRQMKIYYLPTKIRNLTESGLVVLFRAKMILLNNTKTPNFIFFGCKIGCLFCNLLIFSVYCGETGIRTPGTSQYNGFQDRRNRPLCHLSKTSFQKCFPLKALQRYDFILNKQIVYQFFCYKIFKSYFCIRIINERNKS